MFVHSEGGSKLGGKRGRLVVDARVQRRSRLKLAKTWRTSATLAPVNNDHQIVWRERLNDHHKTRRRKTVWLFKMSDHHKTRRRRTVWLFKMSEHHKTEQTRTMRLFKMSEQATWNGEPARVLWLLAGKRRGRSVVRFFSVIGCQKSLQARYIHNCSKIIHPFQI